MSLNSDSLAYLGLSLTKLPGDDRPTPNETPAPAATLLPSRFLCWRISSSSLVDSAKLRPSPESSLLVRLESPETSGLVEPSPSVFVLSAPFKDPFKGPFLSAALFFLLSGPSVLVSNYSSICQFVSLYVSDCRLRLSSLCSQCLGVSESLDVELITF